MYLRSGRVIEKLHFKPENTLRGRIMRCRDFYDYYLCTYNNPLMMIPIGQELGSEKPNRHACNATLQCASCAIFRFTGLGITL